MAIRHWLTILACVGHFVLMVVVAARARRATPEWPMLALCADLFLVNAAHVVGVYYPAHAWRWLEAAAASLLTPAAVHLVLRFVGRHREQRTLLVAVDAACGLLALVCLSALAVAPARAFAGSPAWAVTLLCVSAPPVVIALVLLRGHLRNVGSVTERARTYLFFTSFALGMVGCLSYLLADVGVAVTRPANTGTLFSVALLTAVVLRAGVFERNLSNALAASAVAAGCVPVLAYLAVLRYPVVLLALGTVSVTVAVYSELRGVFSSQSMDPNRVEQLATLGRLSAQMAHDLRNPLAAIKGAAQYLQEEVARGHSLAEGGEFLTIIEDEAGRMERVIERYRRLGRVEPDYARAELNELVGSLVERQALAARKGVSIVAAPTDASLPCELDSDLISAALENLIRNAIEALREEGGTVTVRTARVRAPAGEFATLAVEDNGRGMDARVRARVFQDFFTTKAQGSGLGLAFVRRVMEAHGGVVEIESEERRGTVVRCTLPLARTRASMLPPEAVPTG